ncbi:MULTISPECIES: hypothetical protein [unclassified Ruegeria]|uniref:hypothetical protein n=1 Tax=unclassified Ruegeria TaxID=2625375 RepID=UPI0020C2F485|nr:MULTISPECIES: hypothetical protein [unclassified Ruegeria]
MLDAKTEKGCKVMAAAPAVVARNWRREIDERLEKDMGHLSSWLAMRIVAGIA